MLYRRALVNSGEIHSVWVDAKGGLSALFFGASRALYGRAPCRLTPYWAMRDLSALAKEALRRNIRVPVGRLCRGVNHRPAGALR